MLNGVCEGAMGDSNRFPFLLQKFGTKRECVSESGHQKRTVIFREICCC
jgi:hypothetical protein